MSQGNHLGPPRCGWGDRPKLVGMLDMLPGPRTLGQLGEQLPMGPHREDPVSLAHLDHHSCHRRRRREPIQDPIVRQIAIPAHFALFGSKAFPGKGGRQRRERLPLAALAFGVRGSCDGPGY